VPLFQKAFDWCLKQSGISAAFAASKRFKALSTFSSYACGSPSSISKFGLRKKAGLLQQSS